ncbi:uncharacterized protein V1513DRAFT_450878 [Lipomyces chichibuensis]|uniref:uncharacterized protein n=1 Tax=Lipomyces chichibuensis TaxID=1546026 RepID=UPI003343DE01
MSVSVLANSSQSSDNDSLGNSKNPVSIDLDDDVIMQTPAVVSERNDFPTETELRDGLRRLDDLYCELLSLRIAAPKLIRTLTQIEGNTEPSEVYARFATRAREILGEIERFMTAYKNASDIFSYAEKSRAENPDGLERSTFASLSSSEVVKENEGDEQMML